MSDPGPRDRWLPDMLRLSESVGSCEPPVQYRPKEQIRVKTQRGQFTLSTEDQFDPSDPTFLRIARGGFVIRIPWDIVSGIRVRSSDATTSEEAPV